MSFKIGINRYKSEVGEDYGTERQLFFSLFIKLAAMSIEWCDLEHHMCNMVRYDEKGN